MISNYFFFGCKFPLPLPDGLPVVLVRLEPQVYLMLKLALQLVLNYS